MKSYKNSDILLPYPKYEDIISIATAVASLRTVISCAFVRVPAYFETTHESYVYLTIQSYFQYR
jgi:hypothetical protein